LETRIALAWLLQEQGSCADAEKAAREAYRDARETLGDEDETTLWAMRILGFTLGLRGKLNEAEPLARKRCQIVRKFRGADHENTLDARFTLLYMVYNQGCLDEAEALLKENLEAHRRSGRKDDDARAIGDQGWVPLLLQARGKWDEAERKFREVDRASRRVLGPEHYETISNLSSLAVLLHARGKSTEAGPLLRECVRLYRKTQPNHPYAAQMYYAWANFLLDKNEFKQAELELLDALRIQRRIMVKDHYSIGQALSALGWALTKTGRAKEGESHLREGLDICRRSLPRNDWFTADTESLLGGCLLEQRHFEQAAPFLVGGYKGLVAAAGSPPVTQSWPIHLSEGPHGAPGAPPERTRQALERVIALYELWDKPDQAAVWRAKRKAIETPGLAK
jgi:non-specific serine/threonine protein kinase/serine/threonine-protein kinase